MNAIVPNEHWIPLEERLSYYLNDVRCGETIPQVEGNLYRIHRNEEAEAYPNLTLLHYRSVQMAFQFSTRAFLWYMSGDKVYVGPDWPVLVKTRDSMKKKSKGVIFKVKPNRHFTPLSRFLPNDCSWDAKRSEVVWRGTRNGRNSPSRVQFVQKYGSKYDVRIIPFIGQKERPAQELGFSEMLKFKYLPVLRGNDKASALAWVLASGSVPIMAQPRFHSWACEPWLKPGVHFQEMREDFSDFEDQIEYLRAHDDHAREIAHNGWKFISQFYDDARENQVLTELMRRVDALYDRRF